MSEIKDIPKHWQIKKLGEVCDKITKGGTPTTYGFSFVLKGINFIKVENIENGKVILPSIINFISEEAHLFQRKSMLKENDLLYSIAGTIGRTCLIKEDYLPANTNQALAILRGYHKHIQPQFLTYQLNSSISQFVKSKARGGAMNNISLEDLKTIDLVLPPLPEQQAIVAKIEELFSSLDKGIESLKTARQELKIYRQAVLKWAFEGRKQIIFDELIESSQNGISKRNCDEGDEFKVLRLADITNSKINHSNPRHIKLTISEIAKYKLRENDLLCIRVNGSKDLVGSLIFVDLNDEVNNWTFCDHFIRFILKPEIAFSKFYYYYFKTVGIRKYIHHNMVTSAGQNTVSQGPIKNIMVPIVPLKEQQAIVSEIEDRLSVCDKLEESIEQSLQQAEVLRQSILKQAFEGKLVSQYPNAEPASVLPDKITDENKVNKRRR